MLTLRADRFSISLALIKKTLSAVDDANFVELLRLQEGILQTLLEQLNIQF